MGLIDKIRIRSLKRLFTTLKPVTDPIYHNIIAFMVEKGLCTYDEWNAYCARRIKRASEDLWLLENLSDLKEKK
jgi:hypothetical protein